MSGAFVDQRPTHGKLSPSGDGKNPNVLFIRENVRASLCSRSKSDRAPHRTGALYDQRLVVRELEGPDVIVDRPLAVDLGNDEVAEILVDLNAAGWLQPVDPLTDTVSAEAFCQLHRVTRKVSPGPPASWAVVWPTTPR